MSAGPQPVIFERILKAKPWGGRALVQHFGISSGSQEPIGESWEIVDLPGDESRVRAGPLKGASLRDLVSEWGARIVDPDHLVDGRFPLLIKYLDARENLSVQVHPRPRDDAPDTEQPGVKHEGWYVLSAEPGAALYVGLRDAVTPDELRTAANTPRSAELLKRREVRAGDCLYLPSGTPHALGGGILVAEIQTPSDVTYRLYDWQRVGLDGRPRELHIEHALANVRYDVAEQEIVQARRPSKPWIGPAQRLATCGRFAIDVFESQDAVTRRVETPGFAVWMVLAGHGALATADAICEFSDGDTILIPAACPPINASLAGAARLLHITLPAPDDE